MPTSAVTGSPSCFARRTSSMPAADDRRQMCTRAPLARCSSKIVCSATVSATTGIDGSPSRPATGPAAATPEPASVSSTGRSHSGRSKVFA